MATTVRDAIGPLSREAGSSGGVYEPGSDSSTMRICQAVDGSVRASRPASAASAEEKKSASSLLRPLCLRARSSLPFASARSKSRRMAFSASPVEALHEYAAFAPDPLTTIWAFLRAEVHHELHFSSGTI